MCSGCRHRARPGPGAILSAFLLSLAVTVAASGRKCEPITIPLCLGIGYKNTSFPNHYGHEKQDEAGLEVHQFYPLVEYGCYKHLKFFLCAMYTPICQENYDRPILPCRELCDAAQTHCSPIMQQYGFRWPETLACAHLPSRDDQMTTGEICAAPPDTANTRPPKKTNKLVGVDDDGLDAEVGISDCACLCASPYVRSEHAIARVGNVSFCAHPCTDADVTPSQRAFLQSWMGIWSTCCLAACAFTLITFLIEPERFQYPERPIFILAACQFMVAVGVVTRLFIGHESVACDMESNALRASQEGDASVCFLIFLLTYFFGMAAGVWWVLLSLTWVLAAGSKWSSEAIASYALHFHAVGWLLPTAQTLLVIFFNAIDGDPVTGLCSVGNTNVAHLRVFVLGPLVVYFAVGVFFLFIGFFNLWRIRVEVRRQHLQSSLTTLISKIGVFSVLYTLPALFTILVLFYEQERRPEWEAAALCPCSTGVSPPPIGVSFWLALLKTASQLVVGLSVGIWVLSAKTAASWRARLCCLPEAGRSSSTAKYRPAELIYAKSDASSYPPHQPPYMNSGTIRAAHHYGGYGDKV